MRYCLVYGAYYSGVWTTDKLPSMTFNSITISSPAAENGLDNGRGHHYSIHDCIFFTGNTNPVGYGSEHIGRKNLLLLIFYK